MTEFINKGYYGCVFRPYLKSDKRFKKTDNYVGKVFIKEKHMQEELKSVELTEKIDPSNVFTVKFIGKSKVKEVKDKKLLKTISECDLFNKPEDIKGCHQLVYEYGGVDFKDLENVNIFEILPLWVNIFKGITLLEKSKLVHQDIKPDNLLYNHNQHKINMIDFGLLQRFGEIYEKQEWSRNNFDYVYYPPEYKISYGLLYTRRKKLRTFNITRNFKTHKKLLKFLNKEYNYVGLIDEYERNLRKKNIEDKSPDEIRKHFTKYASKVDIYSMGITLLEILYDNDVKLKNKPLDNDFKDFIFHIIHPDPSKRYSPTEAHKGLVDICKKHKLMDEEEKKEEPKKRKYNYKCTYNDQIRRYYK